MLFKKKKHLTLRQVHELYLLLKDALPEKEEKNLIDEVEKILEKTVEGTLLKSLQIMYGDIPENINPIDAIILFMAGVKENLLFEYVAFIEGVKNIGKNG